MKDYSTYSVVEAAQEETSINFIDAVKQMDPEVAKKRLSCIVKYNSIDCSFISIAGQFLSLVNTKTCVDP